MPGTTQKDCLLIKQIELKTKIYQYEKSIFTSYERPVADHEKYVFPAHEGKEVSLVDVIGSGSRICLARLFVFLPYHWLPRWLAVAGWRGIDWPVDQRDIFDLDGDGPVFQPDRIAFSILYGQRPRYGACLANQYSDRDSIANASNRIE